jgi:hypothetical protein
MQASGFFRPTASLWDSSVPVGEGVRAALARTQCVVVCRELAPWFHLLTSPADYADEAASALRLLQDAADGPITTLHELGSGGGNIASHLKPDLRAAMTTAFVPRDRLRIVDNPLVHVGQCEYTVAERNSQ